MCVRSRYFEMFLSAVVPLSRLYVPSHVFQRKHLQMFFCCTSSVLCFWAAGRRGKMHSLRISPSRHCCVSKQRHRSAVGVPPTIFFLLTLVCFLPPRTSRLFPPQRHSAAVDDTDGCSGGRGRRGSPPLDGARPRVLPLVRPRLPCGNEGEDAAGQERRRLPWQVITVPGCWFESRAVVCISMNRDSGDSVERGTMAPSSAVFLCFVFV